jgi:hypothetical protein
MELGPRQERLAESGCRYVWNMRVFSGAFWRAWATQIPLPAGWFLMEGKGRVILLELNCCQVISRDSSTAAEPELLAALPCGFRGEDSDCDRVSPAPMSRR